MGGTAMKIYNAYAIANLVVIIVFGSFMANSATTGSMDMSTARLIRVDQSGNGDFKKIQDAIDAVPSNNSELVFIWIKSGTYRCVWLCYLNDGSLVYLCFNGLFILSYVCLSREKIVVPADKPFITLSGTQASNTIITWGDTGEIIESGTLSVFASDFVGRFLTIQVCTRQ
jgi:pectinesterase